MSPARDRSPQRGSSLGRFFNQGQWAILLFLYAAIIFAGTFAVDYRDTSPGHSVGAWLAVWFRNYAFHIGLVCGLVAALALVTLRFGRMFCALPLLYFCLREDLGDYRDKPVPPVAVETVTVMTYCLYPVGPPDGAAVLSEIQQADPDVLLLQRFTNEWSGALHPTLVQKYPYYLPIVRDDYLGTAIYSKRAFDYGDEEQSSRFRLVNQQQARAVIHIDGKPVAIYCLRLLPQLRLKEAETSRLQFADLLDCLRKERFPAIVAGDFGFTRRTKQAKEDLRGELGFEDAHQLVGKGRGGTWPVNHKATWLPLMQLDHVYLSQGLACTECRTGQAAGSDHLPVIARIGFSTTEGGGNNSPTESAKTVVVGPDGLPKTDLPAAADASTPTTAPSGTSPETTSSGNALRGRTSDSGSTAASAKTQAALLESLRTQAALLESLRPVRERPPRRAPRATAEGNLPPSREPWSAGDEPPDRSPDPPPLRAPVGSR